MTRTSQVAILLVDDEPLIRRLGQELLQRLGYRVATAADGPQALESYRRLGPGTLVILDYHLAGANGHQVLKELQALDAGVQVLVASGMFSAREAARLQDEGAKGIIYKPFRLAELEQRIQQVLAGAQAF